MFATNTTSPAVYLALVTARNRLLRAHNIVHTNGRTRTDAPGIDFDEVEFHRVWAGRQVERLCYVGLGTLDIVITLDDIVTTLEIVTTLDIVTTAYLTELATRGDSTAVPALEILGIIETCFCVRGICLCMHVHICLYACLSACLRVCPSSCLYA